MALGFDGHVALVNVLRDSPVGISLILLIIMHPHSGLDFLLQPRHTRNAPKAFKDDLIMIGSLLQSKEGEEAIGRNRILQALPELPDHLLGLYSDS